MVLCTSTYYRGRGCCWGRRVKCWVNMTARPAGRTLWSVNNTGMVVLKADSSLLTFTDRQSVPDTDWNYLHNYFCKMREQILYGGKVWYKEVVKWILSNLSDTYNSSCFSLQSYRFAVYMVVADIDCLSCGSRNNF